MEKPYVFISYAHVDSDIVIPFISKMQKNSISIWYDNGIEAGSEWPEFIAEKVQNCEKFVLFVSKGYLQSQNCKRELNFAISRRKEILSIFLEDVTLTPGMEMQLGTCQAIFRNRFFDDQSFFESVANEPYFNSCRENANIEQSTYIPETVSQTQPYTPPQSHGVNVPETQSPDLEIANLPVKSKFVAGMLSIFLGFIGIHKFYLKQPIRGVIYFLFCLTYIPAVLAVLEGIKILCISDEKFQTEYKCKLK